MKRTTLKVTGGKSTDFLKKQIELYDDVVFEYTNYTASVITPRRKYLFDYTGKGKKPFGMFQKVKSDIIKSNLDVPDIHPNQIKYYKFLPKFEFPEKFYSVDITAAYPSVLRKYEAITEDTYRQLMTKLPKEERLQTIGLLGTTKTRITYKKGEVLNIEKVQSEFSKWFFFCCYITGEVMELARARSKEDFLFYWVDGIAVDKNAHDILFYIESLGYKSKVDIIEGCRLVENTLIYFKNGKKKMLTLPKSNRIENEEAKEFLLRNSIQT
jgi:hypothetical protein